MNYVISGINGWLGHAAAHVLKELRGVSSENILGIGRKSGAVVIGLGKPIKVVTWDEANSLVSGPITFFHFAFSTQDKIESLGIADFTANNREIIRKAEIFISTAKPLRVIMASSGAVYEDAETQVLTADLNSNPYGFLKLEEEAVISEVCEKIAAKLVVVRLWSLSGQDIQNTLPFVLANFILDAIHRGEISIHSDFGVFRRYVDARELILLMLTIAESETSLLFESGGPLVEIRELANEISRQFHNEIKIYDRGISNLKRENRYYSRQDQYEELCLKFLRHQPLSFVDQVRNTISGLNAHK